MPRLSVVTPVLNQAAYLTSCLDSVAALTVDHEHLVVDGGSSDGTVELLRSREDSALRWVSGPDRGQAHAVNKALEMASGDLVMWVNGDDEVVPEGVAAAVEHLERAPAVQAAYGGLDFIDAGGRLRREYRPAGWSWHRYLLLGDYVPTPTFVFRMRRCREVGPLDERWVDAADYDFYLRLTHRVPVDRLRRPHVRFRWHPASKSAIDVWRQQDEARAIRLLWSRSSRDRAVMRGFDHAKRVLLPRLTRGRWPAPFEC